VNKPYFSFATSSLLCVLRGLVRDSRRPKNLQKKCFEKFHACIMVGRMTTTATINATKLALLERAVHAIVRETLQKGFFGSASIEVKVQDGAIQYVRHTLERIER
jgi:hypothetical protein